MEKNTNQPPPYDPNVSLAVKPVTEYGSTVKGTTIQVTSSKSVVITEPIKGGKVVVREPLFGAEPCAATCPKCRAYVLSTDVEYETGVCTWLAFSGCLLLGCWLGCCLIPFCVDHFKDVRHTCPNCHGTLGFYRRC